MRSDSIGRIKSWSIGNPLQGKIEKLEKQIACDHRFGYVDQGVKTCYECGLRIEIDLEEWLLGAIAQCDERKEVLQEQHKKLMDGDFAEEGQ